MNISDESLKDPLQEFIDPVLIEKAPEGFTEKVMSGIQSVALKEPSARHRLLRPVPVVATVITLLLIIVAAFSGNTDSLSHPILRFPQVKVFTLPEIDLTRLFSFTLPVVLGYIILGVLLLGVLDKALFTFFNRNKEAGI